MENGYIVAIVAIIAIVIVFWLLKDKLKKFKFQGKGVSVDMNMEETNTQTNMPDELQTNKKIKKYNTVEEMQNNITILFVDDDTKFKLVDILKDSGFNNTKIIKDINSLESNDVQKADILFIDIQGVGKKMAFKDEGLGLAVALKNKYKNKIIVIYSAETRGNRFHNALRKVDDFLGKNADPYEFQQIIENSFLKD